VVKVLLALGQAAALEKVAPYPPLSSQHSTNKPVYDVLQYICGGVSEAVFGLHDRGAPQGGYSTIYNTCMAS